MVKLVVNKGDAWGFYPSKIISVTNHGDRTVIRASEIGYAPKGAKSFSTYHDVEIDVPTEEWTKMMQECDRVNPK